jgi:hypothetical protein
MALLTGDEFAKKKVKTKTSKKNTPNSPPPSPDRGGASSKIEYLFKHPDNSEQSPISHKFKLEVGKDVHEIEVKEGVIKVYDKSVKEALITKGYLFKTERTKQ